MRSRLLLVSLALGPATALFAQHQPAGQLVLRPAVRDLTLLPGPHFLSGPSAKSPMPNQEWSILQAPPAERATQPLALESLPASAYSLGGAGNSGSGSITIAKDDDRSAHYRERLRKLQEQREAALARQRELDAEIGRLQQEQAENERLEAELRRLKRERSGQPPAQDTPPR